MSGKEFATLMVKALEDIDRRVCALERSQPLALYIEERSGNGTTTMSKGA